MVKKQLVKKEHIQKGIDRYKGEVESELQKFLKQADWHYTPYQFEDGRIMCVYEDGSFAFLYENKELVIQDMQENQ